LIAYNVANDGGKPIVITTIGGALRNGSEFLLMEPNGVKLPHTLQPGESFTAVGPLPEKDMSDVHVLDAPAFSRACRCSR
jgi:hypothetical protein